MDPKPGETAAFFGELSPEARETANHPFGPKPLRMLQMACGAYMRDGFDGEELDRSMWRPMSEEGDLIVRDGRIVIGGTTDAANAERRFLGIIIPGVFPAGAVLVADMQAVSGLVDEGRLAYVVHLCGRSPDHNCEVTFTRMPEDGVGWYLWYLDPTGFMKWEHSKFGPAPPFGDEEGQMHTVVVEHNAETFESKGFVLHDGELLQIGETVKMVTHFSAPEIKIDTDLAGRHVEMHVDNVRLYPHPAQAPCRVQALRRLHSGGGPELLVYGVTVKLTLPDGREISALTDRTGKACLPLPEDIVYPVSAEVEVTVPPDFRKTATIERHGLDGLYPGDFWALHLD